MIRFIFSDIDGVLTDGTVQIDAKGNELKAINYRDLDAINIARQKGLDFAFITGEDTPLARHLVKRFRVQYASFGAKDKEKAVQDMLQKLQLKSENIVYIGDSPRDIPAIKLANYGITPKDAPLIVKDAADIITDAKGGKGVLLEVVQKIIKIQEKYKNSRKIVP